MSEKEQKELIKSFLESIYKNAGIMLATITPLNDEESEIKAYRPNSGLYEGIIEAYFEHERELKAIKSDQKAH